MADCALCLNPVRGHASVTVDGQQVDLCHPDVGPDCYRFWTVYGYRPSRRVARWLNDWPSDREWDERLSGTPVVRGFPTAS